MQIHRIRGRDLREALQKAGRIHGQRAVVLGHESVPGGGVTVAVADARREQVAVRPARPSVAPIPLDPGRSDVERVLRRSGSSDALVAEVLDAVAKGQGRGTYALDVAARALGEMIAVAPSPKVRKRGPLGSDPIVIAFFGPRRAGKTTAVAKLATRLAKAGRRTSLVTLDPSRPGALTSLSGYAELLQVPVDGARDAAQLRHLVERSRNRDAVLVDGSGRAADDVALLRELRALAPAARLVSYLVAPAPADRIDLDESAAQYGALEPAGLVITKLDRTHTPAPVLEHSRDSGIPLAFLCDGARAVDSMRRPTADLVADLFLRGRLT